MKLIIAGSRTIGSQQAVTNALFAAGYTPDAITEVVSGGARGVDVAGEFVAGRFGIPVKRFRADWRSLGKSAGYVRNAAMADYADELLAVWDGVSKGTQHMINLMKKAGKKVTVHIVSPDERIAQPERVGL